MMDNFAALVEKFGEGKDVKAFQIAEFNPELLGWARSTLVKGSKKGWYKIELRNETSENVEMEETVMAMARGVTALEPKSALVPARNPNYVPWGCYKPIMSVIQKGVFCPVYVIGDSGNGKSEGVEQACARSGRELIKINITNETCEEDLIGTFTLNDGSMSWVDGPVTRAMRRGAVLLLDEVDQFTSRGSLAIQEILNGKSHYIKKTNEVVHPAPGFTIIATANTKGLGDRSDRFAGAMVMNEAFLERFSVTIEQDYPTVATETKIMKKLIKDNDQLVDRLIRFANTTRKAFKDGAVSAAITTRRLVQIAKNFEVFGNETLAVKYAVARFDDETRDAFVELYTKHLKDDGAADLEKDPAKMDLDDE